MDKKKLYVVGGVGIAALLLWYYRQQTSVAIDIPQSVPAVDESGMNIPGYRGGDFISDIDILVNPSLLGMLQQKMMPLYGFVGTTVVERPVYIAIREPKRPSGPMFVASMKSGGGGGGSKANIKSA